MIGSSLDQLRRVNSRFYSVPWAPSPSGWQELRVLAGCLLTSRLIAGDSPRHVSESIKQELGVRYVLPLNRARYAIELALRALQVGPDDDVVLPSYVSQSVLIPVDRVGARPVFAEVGPSLHLSPDTLERAITSRTKVVIAPHLFGNSAPIDQIERKLRNSGIALIDDAAQSFGAQCAGRPLGTFGTCGVISVGSEKSLAGPAGGFLVSNNREFFERVAALPLGPEEGSVVVRRLLDFLLWQCLRRYTLPFQAIIKRCTGTNLPSERASLMSNLDGAIALEQYRSLKQRTAHRRRNAKLLLEALGSVSRWNISDLSEAAVVLCLVLVFPPKTSTLSPIRQLLQQYGIETRVGFVPLHRSLQGSGRLPVTEDLSQRTLTLPVTRPLKRKRITQLLSAIELQSSLPKQP